MDILPTIAEAIGAAPPRGLEGTSLWPVFRGEKLAERSLFWDRGRQRAVRRGRWKLLFGQKGKAQLYDLEADPGEKADLAAQKPELATELRALHYQWRATWRKT